MKRFFPLFIIFNLICLTLFAKRQNPSADSLKKLIFSVLKDTTKRPDTLTIQRINTLADNYFESSPDSTYYYGNLEIKLSKKINYLKGIADGTVQIAAVNTFHGEYTESTQNYTIALNIYKQLNNIPGISDSYIGLGRVQDYLGNYDNAIRLFSIALDLCVKTKREMDIADCYVVMGITYDNKGDFSKALDCYFKSLAIDIKNKSDLAAADNYCNIGVIMQHVELYPKALNYFNHALSIWQHYDDDQGISTASQNIGEVLLAQKKYDEAIIYINKAAAIVHKMDDREGISLVDYDLGLYNYYTGHADAAINYLYLSLQSAKQNKIKYNKAYAYKGLALVYNSQYHFRHALFCALNAQYIAGTLGSISVKADATLEVSKALAGLKNYKKAYKEYQLYTSLKDSLNNNESIQKLIFYNLEVDFSKKQRDVAEQQHLKEDQYRQKIADQKNTNLIYAIIIVVMATLVIVYYLVARRRQKTNNLLAEKNKEIILQQENLNTQSSKLNDLNLLKDRLIGVLAHDLRAPISTLRGLFNLMIDSSITLEEFIDMIPRVFNTLEHTSDFLDTLLFWINSQVDASGDTIKSFDIQDLVTRELTHLHDQLNQKGITVITNITPGTTALADPNSVRIVIHNFLTNAIKFSHRNSTIDISSELHEATWIIFRIKDNGIGMTKEYLQSLFKSQVVSAIGTENETGTGLGLLFCKDLIEKSNGKIWAESVLGEGSELCFVLPVG